MGIFSVKCECGNRVSKRARKCNHCGRPTPGGWWKCPGCGKWVGNDVAVCSHCGTNLYPEERESVAGGVWVKSPKLFAHRFEVGDLLLGEGKTVLVQEGTSAILMEAGEVTGILEAGRHGLDGTLRKINWFGAPPPRSVVMVDSGEVIVPLMLENLRTAEHFPLEFYGEVVLRFGGSKEAGKAFVANVLKEGREYSFGDFAKHIEPWIRGVVDEMCTTSTVDDLVRDPERRVRLRERMEARLSESLAACGMRLIRVSGAEFSGNEYENYEEKLADVDRKRREEEYQAALRGLANKGQMADWKDQQALSEYKADLDAEWRVGEETRAREFELLKREWEHDDRAVAWLDEIAELEHKQEVEWKKLEHSHKTEDAEQEHRHGQEKREVAHGIETGRQMDGYEREKTVEDARAAVTAQKLHSEQDVADATAWVGVKAKKQALALEAKAAEAERRSRMSIEQLLADIEDPTAREQLIKLYHLKLQAGMTAQQILATLGQSDHDHDAEFLQKMDELYQQNAARADKNLSRIVDPLKVDVAGRISRSDYIEKSEAARRMDTSYREDRHHQEEIPGKHEEGGGR